MTQLQSLAVGGAPLGFLPSHSSCTFPSPQLLDTPFWSPLLLCSGPDPAQGPVPIRVSSPSLLISCLRQIYTGGERSLKPLGFCPWSLHAQVWVVTADQHGVFLPVPPHLEPYLFAQTPAV